MGATLEPPGEREICASDRSQSGSTGSRAGACPRRLEQAASVGRWKISDGCNGEFPLRWSMEGVGAARRCARLIYNTKGNCGIIPRSQGARRAEMSVKSASRRTPALRIDEQTYGPGHPQGDDVASLRYAITVTRNTQRQITGKNSSRRRSNWARGPGRSGNGSTEPFRIAGR